MLNAVPRECYDIYGVTFDWLCWECCRPWCLPFPCNTSFIRKLCSYSTCENSFVKFEIKDWIFFRKTIPIKSHWFLHSIERNCCSYFFFAHILKKKCKNKKFQIRCYVHIVIPNGWYSIGPLECCVMACERFLLPCSTGFSFLCIQQIIAIYIEFSDIFVRLCFLRQLLTWSSYETSRIFFLLTAGVLWSCFQFAWFHV